MGIQIVIPVKYSYLVGMSRWENLCIYPSYFLGPYHIKPYWYSNDFTYCRYEDSCMVYRPEWYQKHKYSQIPICYWYQKMWNPHYRYLNGSKKRWYQCRDDVWQDFEGKNKMFGPNREPSMVSFLVWDRSNLMCCHGINLVIFLLWHPGNWGIRRAGGCFCRLVVWCFSLHWQASAGYVNV